MASSAKFQVGDVLRLKSGGPEVVVMAPSTPGHPYSPAEGHVRVTWFDEHGDVKEHVFAEDLLELAK
jgi:uncharacterized protein YodC (DUF2158 family)